jgi:putative peptidoglycan lipid II flippase
MDAFNVAFRIPNLLRDLFAEGAMSAAFVPTFTRCLTVRGKEEAWRLGNTVINALLLATGLVALVGIVFAEPLVRLLAADYAMVPGKFELTVSLTRVMWPFLTLVAVAAACMGMLNSLRRFFVPAFSPAMFNVGTILCVVLLVPIFRSLGVTLIMAVAVGTLVGGFGQIAIQWPLLRREGYRYRTAFDPRDEGLREILALMVPAVVGLAAVQVNVLVNTMLASRGGHDGPVTWLMYAFRLMYMPIGLFGVSIATAALPSISRHAAQEDTSAMRGTLSSGIRMMLMFNVPATAGLIALASPIIALLFERGRFTPADTAATAAAVVCYAPGLVGYSTVKIAVPAFYALQNSRVPVAVSVCSMLVNVVLNLILYEVMGYRGLALGTASPRCSTRALCGSCGAGWVVSTEAGSRPRSSRSRSRRPSWLSQPGTSTVTFMGSLRASGRSPGWCGSPSRLARRWRCWRSWPGPCASASSPKLSGPWSGDSLAARRRRAERRAGPSRFVFATLAWHDYSCGTIVTAIPDNP